MSTWDVLAGVALVVTSIGVCALLCAWAWYCQKGKP